MKNKAWSGKVLGKNGWLYPMLVIAAILLIIFSALGVATLTGLIPAAQSGSAQQQAPPPNKQPQSVQPPAKRAAPTRIAATACDNCGVVNAINAVEVRGQSSWLGVVAAESPEQRQRLTSIPLS